MEYGNGDGILFYPGHMPFYPEEDRGLNILLPSIRLKNIRRGQQDAEIMWMAEQKAGREKVLGIINKVVPKALSEVSMTDAVQWSQRGDDFDQVREELLKLVQSQVVLIQFIFPLCSICVAISNNLQLLYEIL
jgi:hypothetical protein